MGAFLIFKRAVISIEEKLLKEIKNIASELMDGWPSSRDQQKRFVLEYVGTGFTNGAEAARNAGYSQKYANKTASNMLKGLDNYRHIPPVVEELKKAFEKRNDGLKIANGTEVLQRLTRFGRQEAMEKYYRSERTIDGETVVEENRYITTPSDEDALKSLELLGKSYGLFTDKIDAQVDGSVTIIDDIPEE